MNPEEMLQRAIRAARAGYKQPASQLLQQVLEAEPDNEEALLWFVRVTDSPETKETSLQRVLEINPNNRWAAEQLRALQAGETPLTPTQFDRGSKLETLACPNCGGAVELQGGEGVKTVVCRFCGSVLDLTAEQAAIIGQGSKQIKADVPIELGQEATFEKVTYQVIGWLRYEGWDDEESWQWDEFLLASLDGQFRWLSYSPDEGFVFQQKMTPRRAFNPRKAKVIAVPPKGEATVTERASAKVIDLAGELTWQGKIGDRINYLEAHKGRRYRYSVEYTDQEIELMGGQVLSNEDVAKAFGHPDTFFDHLETSFSENGAGSSFNIPMSVVAFIVVIFLCVCVCPIFLGGGDGSRSVGIPVCPPGVTPQPIVEGVPAPTPCPTATPSYSSSFDDDDDGISIRGGGFSFGGGGSSGGGFSGGK